MRRLNGGALYYAIAISIIILLLILLFISLLQYNKYELDSYIIQEKLYDDEKSALSLVLSNPSIIEYNQNDSIDIFDDNIEFAQLYKEHWGMFNILNINVRKHNYSINNYFLLGTNLETQDSIALYYPENGNYLSVSNDSWINGNVFAPKYGIKKSNVQGELNYKDNACDGEIFRSALDLPDIDIDLKQYIEHSFDTSNLPIGYFSFDNIKNQKKIVNSFKDSILYIISSDSILISGSPSMSGKILVKSFSKIVIEKNANLKNIIIFAPVIIIRDGFNGTIQCFASDSLVLEKNVSLNYPSYLCLFSKQNNSVLIINDSCLIEGGIMSYSKNDDHELINSYINNCTIYGQLYCNGTLWFCGKIVGSCFAQHLMLQTSNGTFEDYLYNTIIDFKSLPKGFASYAPSTIFPQQKCIQKLN